MPAWRGRQNSGKPCLKQSIPQVQEISWGFLPAPQGAQMAGHQPLELCCWQEGVWDGGRASEHQHFPAENLPPAASAACKGCSSFTLTHLGRERHRQLLQERLWEQGKALGKRKPKEPEELRASDGSQPVCRLRGWSLESPSAVARGKISGRGSQAGELARRTRGCEDLLGKGRTGRAL